MISFPGTKLITLAVCNASSCASAFTTVLVGSASPPVFEFFGCDPPTVQPKQAVTCSALVFKTQPGATYSWSAPGALPPSGSGGLAEGQTVSFIVSYAALGGYTVTFTACNGPSCASLSDSFKVVLFASTVP